MSFSVIIGIGIVAFIISYIFFKTDDYDSFRGNVALKILLLGVLLSLFVLVGKATYDSNTVCELVVTNQTVSGSETSFNYESFCYESVSTNTAELFYISTLWIVRLLGSALIIWLFYQIFVYLDSIIRGKRGRNKND